MEVKTTSEPYKGMLEVKPDTSIVSPKAQTLNESTFIECIIALSKNLESKSPGPDNVQDLFFKLANGSRRLPENVGYEIVDSFIAILTTIISVNYGYPLALKGLNTLFTYLKRDDRVFNRFYPNKQLLLKLNLDKYLCIEEEEEKTLIIDFLCFLFRYYDDIQYSDLTSDLDVQSKIKKAETRHIWSDIENLAVNQETMLRNAEYNQKITSNAFIELFMYMDEIKKKNEETLIEIYKTIDIVKLELNNKMDKMVFSEVNVDVIKRTEERLNERLNQLQGILDKVVGKTSSMETNQDLTSKKLHETLNVVEGITAQTKDMLRMMEIEAKFVKDTRSMLATRMSNTENEVLALSHNLITMASKSNERDKEKSAKESDKSLKEELKESQKSVNKGSAMQISELKLDTVKNQVDIELIPKLNEMQVRLGAIEVIINSFKAQDKSPSIPSNLLAKVNEKGITAIAELIKIGQETTSSEIVKFKQVLNVFKDQSVILEKAQELLRKDMDAKIKKTYENLKSDIDIRQKQMEEIINIHAETNEASFKSANDRIELLKSEMESYIKKNDEFIDAELKNLNASCNESTQRVIQLEAKEEALATRFDQLEENVALLEGKLTGIDEVLLNMKNREQSLSEWVQFLKTRPGFDISSKELQMLREELSKRFDHVKHQTSRTHVQPTHAQSYTDSLVADKAREIKSTETNYTTKLNALAWIIQNREQLNRRAVVTMLEAFKEATNALQTNEQTPYPSVKHLSNIMSLVVTAIRNCKRGSSGEELRQTLLDLNIYLSVLEYTLMNDQNLETGLSLGILKDLMQLIILFTSSYELKHCLEEFKLAVRCIAYCFRNVRSIDSLLEVQNGMGTIVSTIQSVKDEEITANLIKVIRVCLRSEKHYDKIIQKSLKLFYVLIQLVALEASSPVILEETTAALRSYTRKPYVLDNIDDPTILNPLCKLAAGKEATRARDHSIAILRNCCKNQKLLSFVKQTSAFDIIFKYAEDASITHGEIRYN